MKNNTEHRGDADLRDEYDFASMKGGVRGKHYNQHCNGTNVVLIEPNVGAAFPTEDAANEAPRGILGTPRDVRRTGGGPKRRVRRSTR